MPLELNASSSLASENGPHTQITAAAAALTAKDGKPKFNESFQKFSRLKKGEPTGTDEGREDGGGAAEVDACCVLCYLLNSESLNTLFRETKYNGCTY